MFDDMHKGFERVSFPPIAPGTGGPFLKIHTIQGFLSRFDAIFTLNQDLLLERHYLIDNLELLSRGKWKGHHIPGMVMRKGEPRVVGPGQWHMLPRVPLDPKEFVIHKGFQPYIKLHGSINWYGSADEEVMVLGGNKTALIREHEILRWNFEQFVNYLRKPQTRLMVIGYSFSDPHINAAIGAAVETNAIGVFIVDPHGIDVLDKNRGAPIHAPDQLALTIWPNVIGASRRSLLTTFGGDHVEHAKLMRFF